MAAGDLCNHSVLIVNDKGSIASKTEENPALSPPHTASLRGKINLTEATFRC